MDPIRITLSGEVNMQVPDEILNRYIERRKRDLESCFRNIEEGKYEELEKVGHQLKGNGETFGHPELSDIGRELEEAARESDDESVHQAVEKFKNWVDRKIN